MKCYEFLAFSKILKSQLLRTQAIAWITHDKGENENTLPSI